MAVQLSGCDVYKHANGYKKHYQEKIFTYSMLVRVQGEDILNPYPYLKILN